MAPPKNGGNPASATRIPRYVEPQITETATNARMTRDRVEREAMPEKHDTRRQAKQMQPPQTETSTVSNGDDCALAGSALGSIV